MTMNIVELIADPDECGADQRCKFGNRVEDHAVYCHNDSWTNSPRKCRRSWYTGGEVKDEDCPGFQRNEAFTGVFLTTELVAPICSVCGGAKLVPADPQRNTVETCDHCQGTGSEPQRIELAKWEVYVLECCIGHSFRNPFDHTTHILSGEPFRLKEFPNRLLEENLLEIHSYGFDGPARVHTVRLTRKGYAILKMNWASKRSK